MTVRVVHARVDTQADEQLVLDSGGVCPSHWNADHSLVGMSEIELNIRGIVIIDMNNDNYTMTYDEAISGGWVILNGGSGKTLTSPSSADAYIPTIRSVVTAFTANPIYYKLETDNDPILISAPNADIVAASAGLTPLSFYNQNISDTAYAASWDGDLMAPTKNAVYDKIQSIDNSYNQSFLLMGG